MGRHVAIDNLQLERLVDDSCAAIGREIEEAGVPRLAGVVLGGGYGRGEGGVREECKVESVKCKVDGCLSSVECRLSNDLDFFAITEEGADEGSDVLRIAAALEPISRKWTRRLGVDVDFTVKTPWRLRHDERRIMIQELVRGYCDVAGRGGADLFASVVRRSAEELPWGEAARLLMNRGMGLLLASEPGMSSSIATACDFVNRNINKCVLGAGDARLVVRRSYRWRAVERADALGDALYSRALEWKFHPRSEPVCDWETARSAWIDAFGEVMEEGRRVGALGRSVREAARWLARRRTFGEPSSFAQDCTVRVLKGVERAVRGRLPISPALMRDWEVFN